MQERHWWNWKNVVDIEYSFSIVLEYLLKFAQVDWFVDILICVLFDLFIHLFIISLHEILFMRYFTCFVNVSDKPAVGHWNLRKRSISDKE